ncbi:hypothetical protein L0F63_000758 [Massospora cicadina]|nr:hypothetical protein L0F63_000758 [Massospora cicadina]
MGQDPSYSKSYSDQELTTSKTKLNSPPNPHCSPRKFSGGKSVPRKSVGGGERRSALIGVSYGNILSTLEAVKRDRWDARTPLAGYARRYVPDSGPDNRRDERDGSSPPLTSDFAVAGVPLKAYAVNEAKPLKSLTWRSPKRIKQYADWRSFLPPPAPARPKQPAPPSPELKVSAKAPAGPFTQLTDQQIFKLQGQEKRVYEILEHQLDIEIFQKQRELAEIHHELSIGYRLLDKFTKQAKSKLRRVGGWFGMGPPDLRWVRFDFAGAAEEQLTKPEAAGLFARWEDGLFVRIVCPECGKGNFEDEGLFLDHLRKLHSIAYPSIQEAYAGCGLSIPAYQVPPTIPAAAAPPSPGRPMPVSSTGVVMFKQFQEARAQLYQERPKIKVYDEEIDLGTWVDAQPTPEPAPVPLAMLREAKEGVISDEPEHEMTEDEQQSPAADIPNKTLATHQGFPQGLPLIHADLPCPPPLPGQDCSVVARLMLEETSRFHVRKTIVFGNISKPVTTDGEGGEPTFFRWLVYVSGPPYAPDLSSFVARVKFILHPSYAPHDVARVGEFPVRAQLTFHDARNKSVELIHNLTKLCLDFEPHEAEDRFEIELDRDTGFVPAVAQPPTPSASEDNVPASPAPNVDTHALLTRLLEAFPIVAREPQPRLAYRPVGAPSQLASLRPAQRQSLEWHRANAMLAALRRELGPQRSSPLSSKQVLLWCRAHDPLLAELEAGGYCVVCGRLASQLRPVANRCASCQGVRPKLTTLSLPNALLGALPSGWDSLFDPEASNEDLVIDDEPGARTRLPPAALSFTHAAHPPPIPPAELNFTRAAMAPLRLPCAPADRTSHVAMAMATRLFLNALLARIIHSQFPGRQTVSAAASVALNPDDARPPRKVAQLITPMHVWSSLRGARGNLDFLTNAYTGAQ